VFNDAQKTCKCSYCCPLPKGPELSRLSTSVRQSSIVVSQRLPGLKHMSYNERLQYLGLSSLELRRLHLDMIYCNKIVFGVVDLKFSDFFEFSSVTATRGHAYKLYKPSCVNSTRSRYFAKRIVNLWNFLPSSVNFSTLNAFRRSITIRCDTIR